VCFWGELPFQDSGNRIPYAMVEMFSSIEYLQHVTDCRSLFFRATHGILNGGGDRMEVAIAIINSILPVHGRLLHEPLTEVRASGWRWTRIVFPSKYWPLRSISHNKRTPPDTLREPLRSPALGVMVEFSFTTKKGSSKRSHCKTGFCTLAFLLTTHSSKLLYRYSFQLIFHGSYAGVSNLLQTEIA
jgi:hypothetical protein